VWTGVAAVGTVALGIVLPEAGDRGAADVRGVILAGIVGLKITPGRPNALSAILPA
jgi:multidrug transporter EmrE-like cation transporter